MSASGMCSPAQSCIWLYWDRWVHISCSWHTLQLLFQKPFQTILPLGIVYVASITNNPGTAHGLLQGSPLSYRQSNLHAAEAWDRCPTSAVTSFQPFSLEGWVYLWLTPGRVGVCVLPSSPGVILPCRELCYLRRPCLLGQVFLAARKCLCLFLKWEF